MSLRSTLCSSREKVGALAKACVGSSGTRSTLSLHMGSCRRLFASLQSRYARAATSVLSSRSGGRSHAVRGHQSRTTKLLRRNRPARYTQEEEENAVALV